MVICSYFLNNMCRFGTKCNNEHVNVRLTLKTDAEGALRGNQWPLSSYGPFRDKPSIPNFIEDQSFEEIRHLCYEAKITGNVHAVTQQFAQQVNDAKNKMNMIVNPSNEVVTLVTNIYNSSGGGTPANTNASNSFSMNSASSSNQNASSIFGGGAVATGSSGSGIFGAQPSTGISSNPFASNAAGFGAAQTAQSTQSIFGSPAQTQSTIFGGGSTAAAPSAANTGSGGIFGSSGFASNTGNSLFGAANQNKPSIFGSSANAGAFSGTPANASSVFGSAQAAPSIFGGSAQPNPVFGGPATFGSTPSASIFGRPNANLNQQANKASIFGQSSMQSFGGVASQPQTNIFGGGAAAHQQPVQSSIFGGQQTATAQNPGSIFGAPQTQQMPSTNIFGASAAPNGNLFVAAEAPAPTAQTNIFGGPQTTENNSMSNAASIFGGPQSQNIHQQPQQQSIFGAQANPTAQTQSIFGANSFQQAQVQQPLSATVYSSIDALSAEEIAAYNANTFELGHIPTKPPPRECCA